MYRDYWIPVRVGMQSCAAMIPGASATATGTLGTPDLDFFFRAKTNNNIYGATDCSNIFVSRPLDFSVPSALVLAAGLGTLGDGSLFFEAKSNIHTQTDY